MLKERLESELTPESSFKENHTQGLINGSAKSKHVRSYSSGSSSIRYNINLICLVLYMLNVIYLYIIYTKCL